MGRTKQTISKNITLVNAFEEFKRFKFKKHINLQLGAGVDKLFEKLIDDKIINFKNRKRVMDICRDWYELNRSKAQLPMILIDLNQVMISNLMAQNRGNLSELPSKDAVRHSILNTIRAFNVKFKEEYGEMVLCADAADPWRRDIFPNYKHQRRKGRVESQIDWDGLFKIMSDIREEFINKLPFKVLHVDKCEADDIIGTLCKRTNRRFIFNYIW